MKMRAMVVVVGLVLGGNLYTAQQPDLEKQFNKLIKITDDSEALPLIKQYPTLLTYKDYNTGDTALHRIASKGADKVVKLLLQKKVLEMNNTTRFAVLSATNKKGETPFMLAVQKGDKATVAVMLKGIEGLTLTERSQLFQTKNGDGKNVMHLAAYGSIEILKLFLQTDEGRDLLASQQDIYDAAGVLVKKNNGYTPLHVTASQNSEEKCALLIQYAEGLRSMAILDQFLQTPVTIANKDLPAAEDSREKKAMKAFKSMKKFLTGTEQPGAAQWKATLDAMVKNGFFEFVKNANFASLKKHVKVLPGFVTQIDANGKRPLHVALEQQTPDIKIVKALFKARHGFSMLEKQDKIGDNYNDTPLHIAARKLAEAAKPADEQIFVEIINLFASGKAFAEFKKACAIKNNEGLLPFKIIGEKITKLNADAQKYLVPRFRTPKGEEYQIVEPISAESKQQQNAPVSVPPKADAPAEPPRRERSHSMSAVEAAAQGKKEEDDWSKQPHEFGSLTTEAPHDQIDDEEN